MFLHNLDAIEFLQYIPSNSVDCIWTDPPYLLSNDGVTCSAGKRVKVNKGDWDKSQGIEKDHQFNLDWLSECYRILSPTGTIWITGTVHIYLSVGMALLELGFRILNDIIWEKPNPPPNLGCRCFTHSTETIFWAAKNSSKKDKYTFNYKEMKQENDGKQMKNVWNIKAPGKSEKKFGKHPTQKPIALVERCIKASTNIGDLVVDPFAGSGTTGVVCMRLERKFLINDRDENYIKIAKQRLDAEKIG